MRIAVFAALFMVLAAPLVRAEEDAPRIYVVKPGLVDVPDTALPAILDGIGQAAQDEGVQALTENDVATLLRSQATLQALGSEADELSLSTLGKAVGATHLVTATVAKSGDDTTLSFRLVDAKNASVLARRQLKASEVPGGLLEAVKVGTRLVLAPVFAGRKGTLKLTVSETGADVLLDGDVVAVTPSNPLEIPGGTHLVGVRKDRFVAWRETLRIVGGETLDRLVRLRPSPDYLRVYKEDAGRLRVVAWSGTAAALVGAGVAVFFGLRFSAADAQVKALNAQYDALSPLEQQNQQATYQSRINTASADAALNYNVMGVGAIVGALGLGLGGFGWLFGNDPGRYDDLEKEAK